MIDEVYDKDSKTVQIYGYFFKRESKFHSNEKSPLLIN